MAWYGGLARIYFQVASWRTVSTQYRRIMRMFGDRVVTAFPVLVDGDPRIVVYLRIL